MVASVDVSLLQEVGIVSEVIVQVNRVIDLLIIGQTTIRSRNLSLASKV